MSIFININGTQCLQISNDTTGISSLLTEIANLIEHGTEMNICLIDTVSGECHSYVFEYTHESKFGSPLPWTLNNLLYSILCEDTGNAIQELLTDVIELLYCLKKINS